MLYDLFYVVDGFWYEVKEEMRVFNTVLSKGMFLGSFFPVKFVNELIACHYEFYFSRHLLLTNKVFFMFNRQLHLPLRIFPTFRFHHRERKIVDWIIFLLRRHSIIYYSRRQPPLTKIYFCR